MHASEESVYEPLSRRPVPDVIAERLTALIEEGALAPGDRLPSEPELARQFGVGRSSLREAIRKLHTMGVLEAVNGRGTFVRQPPEHDPTLQFLRWSADAGFAAAELLEARIGLEITATGLACLRADTADIEALSAHCAAHEVAHRSAAIDDLVRTDQDVHAALIRAAHNDVLDQLYAPLVPQLSEFRHRTLSLPGSAERSARDHRVIVEAIQDRDPVAAREAVVRHLGTLYREVRPAQHSDDEDAQHSSVLAVFL